MANLRNWSTQSFPIALGASPLAPWFRFAVVDSWQTGQKQPTAPMRALHDFCLHLQLEGRSWVWCEALDGSLDVEPGDLLFLPPGFVHAWAYTGETHLAIHFDLQRNPALTPHNYDHSYDMIRFLPGAGRHRPCAVMPIFHLAFPEGEASETWHIPMITHMPNPALWRERLEGLVYRWQTRKLEMPLTQMQSLRILGWALDTLTTDAAINPHLVDDIRITELLREMQDPARLAALSRLSVIELAHRVGMGVTAFRNIFRIATSRAPHAYIRECQMQHAAYFLRQSTLPIQEIARYLGFDDPYHSSRLFRQHMGCPPITFRRRGSAKLNPDRPPLIGGSSPQET